MFRRNGRAQRSRARRTPPRLGRCAPAASGDHAARLAVMAVRWARGLDLETGRPLSVAERERGTNAMRQRT